MLLAGAFIGMWITSTVQIQQMSGWMVAAMDSARRSQYAFTQYREANYEDAKSALGQFAAYLESQKPASREWQPGEAPLSDEKSLAFDRMLTFGRLAVRAERANRPDDAVDYWPRRASGAGSQMGAAHARSNTRDCHAAGRGATGNVDRTTALVHPHVAAISTHLKLCYSRRR
jgi:hypothetical protein